MLSSVSSRLSRSLCALPTLTKACFSFGLLGPRSLSELTNLPLLKVESTDTVKTIWEEYHKDQNEALGITLTPQETDKLIRRGREASLFLYPSFREEKSQYFILMSQFQDSFFFMTYLENYKRDPQNATPWFSLSLFRDLEAQKNVTLVRVDFLSQYIPKASAERITSLLMQSYLDDDVFSKFTRTFNHDPNTFDFQQMIEWAQRTK